MESLFIDTGRGGGKLVSVTDAICDTDAYVITLIASPLFSSLYLAHFSYRIVFLPLSFIFPPLFKLYPIYISLFSYHTLLICLLVWTLHPLYCTQGLPLLCYPVLRRHLGTLVTHKARQREREMQCTPLQLFGTHTSHYYFLLRP